MIKPIFMKSVYINKNTRHLREKLKELEYDVEEVSPESQGIVAFPDLRKAHRYIVGDSIWVESEELFLALAALRDDTAKFQWFTDGEDVWEKSDSDLPSKYIQLNGHKATVDELLKFFGN